MEAPEQTNFILLGSNSFDSTPFYPDRKVSKKTSMLLESNPVLLRTKQARYLLCNNLSGSSKLSS